MVNYSDFPHVSYFSVGDIVLFTDGLVREITAVRLVLGVVWYGFCGGWFCNGDLGNYNTTGGECN